MQPTEPEREDTRRIFMANKIIAVVGATGAQGGGLCRAILKDKNGGYRVRALTRNTDSVKAKELEKLGAEVVRVDVDDVESLKRAFHGAYGVTPTFGSELPRDERPRRPHTASSRWIYISYCSARMRAVSIPAATIRSGNTTAKYRRKACSMLNLRS